MADPQVIRRSGSATTAAQIDEGLRAHMNSVYGLMSAGMVITGLVAWFVGNNEALLATFFTGAIRWVVMFAPLIFIFAFGAMVNRVSAGTARAMFFAFAALMGLSLAWIFAVFTNFSIAQTFFVTAIAFAGLSIWGYTTKKDISGWGSFLIMGVIGLIVASIINIFLGSPAIMFAISIIGLLVFAGLTAYDTQKIKNTYLQMAHHGQTEWLQKSAIMGALNLYLDFVNMFMFLLNFMGAQE